MRTLKKTLSLVLVVAMVLGLCVVGASAYNKVEDFTDDVAKIGDAYYEAVGVLTGIQVIDGMTETSFQPQGNYTREQAAKIIAYMMLGKADADSLRCTKAPFDDVAADRWSAGYIAFCVEQGIIDGMTETTFEPTGTLTGFQWAKMLLCAVGFGVKGEFTGSSWSLNTAKYAHNVDLFAGDLAGADHTAITREQAALYAFNVLTAVDLVVYSESLGDYIKGYNSWFVDRYTPQGTLAETVFKLYNTTGVVVNNEAMGNGTTDISKDYSGANVIAKVKAGTGLDMMYHGVKVWFTGTAATKTAAASGTAVFVTDLAKVTEYCCSEIATGTAAAGKLTNVEATRNIGDTSNAKAVKYEFDIVDNTAVGQGVVTVTTYASYDYITFTSTLNKYSNFTFYGKVDNANIKTDVSAVTSTTPLVVIKAGDKAYHVFAATATSGAVTGYSEVTGVITLSDGTKLSPSNIVMQGTSTSLRNLKDTLADKTHIAPTYYFVLDTHGHYMFLTDEYYKTVAYFTGVLKDVSAHGSWSNEVAFVAQFVDVEDGSVEEIPVTKEWAVRALADYDTHEDRSHMYGYYDITDELYGDATYAPEHVFVSSPLYGAKYVYADNVDFNAYDTQNKVYITEDSYYRYDPDTVVFYIATGAGSSLKVDKYVGVDALLAGLAEKYNMTVTAANIVHAAMTYTTTSAGNNEVLTVFGYEEYWAHGEFLFFPTDVTKFEYHDDYVLTYAYLNGEAEKKPVRFDKDYFNGFINDEGSFGLYQSVTRGFYWYHINAEGNYEIDRVSPAEWGYLYDDATIRLDTAGSKVWINDIPVSGDFKVVDTRTVDDDEKIETVNDLATLIKEERFNELNIQLAYMIYTEKNEIAALYVVDKNLGEAYFAIDDESLSDWSFSPTSDVKLSGRVFENGYVKLYNEKLADIDNDTVVDLTVKVNYSTEKKNLDELIWSGLASKTVTGVVVNKEGAAPYVLVKASDIAGTGYYFAGVLIEDITYGVTITNQQTEFAIRYKVNNSGDSKLYVAKEEIPLHVGDYLTLAFVRDAVADGTVATVAMNNNDTPESVSVTFEDGTAWIITVNPNGNYITVISITANYQLKLAEGVTVKDYGMQNTSAINNGMLANWVPGDPVDVLLKYAGDKVNTDQSCHAYFTFGGEKRWISNESADDVAKDTNKTITFEDVVFDGVQYDNTNKVNVVTVNGIEWAADNNTHA